MIVYITVTLAMLLFILAISIFLLGSQRDPEPVVFRRFCEVTGYQQTETEGIDLDEELLEGSFYERNIYPFIQRVARLVGGETETKREKLERKLIQAGRPGNLGPNEFTAIQIILGLINISAVILFALGFGPTTTEGVALSVIFALTAGAASYVVPRFYLERLITSRQKAIRKDLPFAIDLLVVSAEAGLGFDMALTRVVDKMEGALSAEFGRVLEEVQLGTPRKRALRNLVTRVEINELSGFVSAVIQAEELGASIGDVLRIQAQQMRIDRRQEIEKLAQQAPVKMLIPMVLFIFPTIFIVVLGPIGLEVFMEMTGIGAV